METKSIVNRNYLYLTVFVAGMSTLAIEFTTSRMLQTVYGTSNIVWANVIGLVLLALTLGYFIGGRWADKRPFSQLPHIQTITKPMLCQQCLARAATCSGKSARPTDRLFSRTCCKTSHLSKSHHFVTK
jgi:hypothetical protein